jgi:L-iditol 2-dehydrogenase
MKAVVKTHRGVGHVVYIDFPEPEPGPGTVKIRVKATAPVVLGHEFSGQVVALGPGVTNAQVGDRVLSELPVEPCGRCRYCQTGRLNLCLNRKGLGWSANGSFAEYLIAEEQVLHRIPDGIDYDIAALIEPLAVASHGVVEMTGVRTGDLVYISGPGPIGLLAAQVARSEGAMVVIGGIGADQNRLNLARRLNIDRVINVEEEDPAAVLQNLSGGLGADVIFECSGAQAAAAQCLNAVRKGGKYTQIGLYGKPIQLDFDRMVMKELRMQGVFSSNWRAWDRALRLVAQNRIELEPLISHRFPLSEWRRAFDLLWSREALKVLLQPGS